MGGQVSVLKGLGRCINWSEIPHRSRSLRSACVVCEGLLLTNFSTCVRGMGICRSFPPVAVVLAGAIFLPSDSLAGQMLVGASSDTPATLPAPLTLPQCPLCTYSTPAGAPTKRHPPCLTQWAALAGTSTSPVTPAPRRRELALPTSASAIETARPLRQLCREQVLPQGTHNNHAHHCRQPGGGSGPAPSLLTGVIAQSQQEGALPLEHLVLRNRACFSSGSCRTPIMLGHCFQDQEM